MSGSTLERRVAALEKELADLKQYADDIHSSGDDDTHITCLAIGSLLAMLEARGGLTPFHTEEMLQAANALHWHDALREEGGIIKTVRSGLEAGRRRPPARGEPPG